MLQVSMGGDQPTISQSSSNVVDGINLEEIKEFAKVFKLRRLGLGLTQTQVGQALSVTEGPAYSQSAICRFEKLDITPKSAQKIKPVLERWMKEAEESYRDKRHAYFPRGILCALFHVSSIITTGTVTAPRRTAPPPLSVFQAFIFSPPPPHCKSTHITRTQLSPPPHYADAFRTQPEFIIRATKPFTMLADNHLTDFIGMEPSKKRKRRTSFTPQALELLNAHFERNTHPSGTEITGLAHQLGYEREVIRIWFCNKRQALKNTVRMMSKGIV
ncbi:hypothetical protein MSG28_010106 [Choristoneura fumiferana]|uniref:Uncharacterized protein n=1 Tax=Choristoneura fumiferana TaxID=7141 RepID=A0ACC0KJA5_CHOFU|nr:hypothetical protein MSG28_010106 [Choristoneura fumiferana]